ncbi:MAG: phytanoyl-CoA dioxygenase family protein [Ktedonobacteraceae bacterium]|nr:phytanoyl-CoA dioxygenase family protein [Ktedonobacteraceae bacterium]
MSQPFFAQPLMSNGFPLTTNPERLGWLVPSDPALPMSQLRTQYQTQGYLWLKGLLPRQQILALRRRFFALFAETGLLAPDSDPVDGLFSGKSLSPEVLQRLWMEATHLPEYRELCFSPHIWRFYEAFLGGSLHLHQRKLVRFTTPGDPACTGGHYDLIYLRAGTDQICTSWLPLGDTPVEMGGLVYLQGSDALGRKMEADFTRKNADLPLQERISAYNKHMASGGWINKDLSALANLIDGTWLLANYEGGDMVVHSPYMIHASTVNFDAHKRMRLSTDIRYQLQSEKIDPRWTNEYHPNDNL